MGDYCAAHEGVVADVGVYLVGDCEEDGGGDVWGADVGDLNSGYVGDV